MFGSLRTLQRSMVIGRIYIHFVTVLMHSNVRLDISLFNSVLYVFQASLVLEFIDCSSKFFNFGCIPALAIHRFIKKIVKRLQLGLNLYDAWYKYVNFPQN